MSKPGEVYDSKGVPIYPGDLLRSFHFRGARRKIYYIYHVAVLNGEHMEMVPAMYLEPTYPDTGGRCWLFQDRASTTQVIQGFGPQPYLSYEDRPRRKIAQETP